jgi:hypothetical protein
MGNDWGSAYAMANKKAAKSMPTLDKVVEKNSGNPDFELKITDEMMRDLGNLVFTADSGKDYEIAAIIKHLTAKLAATEAALLKEITHVAQLEVDVEVFEEEVKFLREKILRKSG